MCTVTYLPRPQGFILTHNRDEAPMRSTRQIEQVVLGGRLCLFPRDTGAGGAWIAAVEHGPTVCLLNGAFVRHERNPPYRRSRGLILMDFLEQPNWETFVIAYDLEGCNSKCRIRRSFLTTYERDLAYHFYKRLAI